MMVAEKRQLLSTAYPGICLTAGSGWLSSSVGFIVSAMILQTSWSS